MGLKKVRLTIWPDRLVEVEADELAALRAQGLILNTKKAASTDVVTTDTKKVSAD